MPLEGGDRLVEGGRGVAEVRPEGQIRLRGLHRLPHACGRRGAAGAFDGDRDVGERAGDGGAGFVDDDLDMVGQAQAVVGDRLGEGLDEVEGGALDDRRDVLGELPVVNGLGDVVGRGGSRRRGVEDDIDDEVLALALLELEDPVVAAHPQSAQLDPVRVPAHRGLHGEGPGPE